jgi:hypothetical protein
MMRAQIFVRVELSDDDVELLEVASQCGYDVRHPLVVDVSAPVLRHFNAEPCLVLELELQAELSVTALHELLAQCQITLSHPSVSAFDACAIHMCE